MKNADTSHSGQLPEIDDQSAHTHMQAQGEQDQQHCTLYVSGTVPEMFLQYLVDRKNRLGYIVCIEDRDVRDC